MACSNRAVSMKWTHTLTIGTIQIDCIFMIEAKEVMDQMLDRLLFDVPEEYHIDRDHFYTYLDDYYENTI